MDDNKNNKGCSIFTTIIFVIIIIFAYMACSNFLKNRPATTNITMQATTTTQGALLNLLSSRGTKKYGFITVVGEIQNISNQKLEDVEVVVTFYDKENNLIATAEAFIQYNPIMPGQTSPFTVMTTDNPLITKEKIAFQFLFGRQINTINSQNK